jgi:hypothetical protein
LIKCTIGRIYEAFKIDDLEHLTATGLSVLEYLKGPPREQDVIDCASEWIYASSIYDLASKMFLVKTDMPQCS